MLVTVKGKRDSGLVLQLPDLTEVSNPYRVPFLFLSYRPTPARILCAQDWCLPYAGPQFPALLGVSLPVISK